MPSAPRADVSMDLVGPMVSAAVHASTVARDAKTNETRSGPQDLRANLISAPSRRRGVAKERVMPWRAVAPADPPGGMQPTEAKTNVRAIAVTGGPRRRPIDVDLPRNWAIVADASTAAAFPMSSPADISGLDGDGSDEVGSERALVGRSDVVRGRTMPIDRG